MASMRVQDVVFYELRLGLRRGGQLGDPEPRFEDVCACVLLDWLRVQMLGWWTREPWLGIYTSAPLGRIRIWRCRIDMLICQKTKDKTPAY